VKGLIASLLYRGAASYSIILNRRDNAGLTTAERGKREPGISYSPAKVDGGSGLWAIQCLIGPTTFES
jgi:hypothetical protein